MTSSEVESLFCSHRSSVTGEGDDAWDAVFALQRDGSREIFDHAAEWLRSGNSLKMARAADVLGQLRRAGSPTEQPEWLFRDESYVLITSVLSEDCGTIAASSAISALGHLGAPAAIPIIAAYTDHQDEDVRFAAAFALECFPNDSRSVEALLKLTTDSNADVRDWSVFGLGVQKMPILRKSVTLFSVGLQIQTRMFAKKLQSDLESERICAFVLRLRSMLDAAVLERASNEAASASLGLPEDPPDWNASDYRRCSKRTISECLSFCADKKNSHGNAGVEHGKPRSRLSTFHSLGNPCGDSHITTATATTIMYSKTGKRPAENPQSEPISPRGACKPCPRSKT